MTIKEQEKVKDYLKNYVLGLLEYDLQSDLKWLNNNLIEEELIGCEEKIDFKWKDNNFNTMIINIDNIDFEINIDIKTKEKMEEDRIKKECGIVYCDNVKFIGSGIDKRVDIKLEYNTLKIENEDFTLIYNGTDFRVYGAYWFKDSFENDTRIKNATMNIYNELKEKSNQ